MCVCLHEREPAEGLYVCSVLTELVCVCSVCWQVDYVVSVDGKGVCVCALIQGGCAPACVAGMHH